MKRAIVPFVVTVVVALTACLHIVSANDQFPAREVVEESSLEADVAHKIEDNSEADSAEHVQDAKKFWDLSGMPDTKRILVLQTLATVRELGDRIDWEKLHDEYVSALFESSPGSQRSRRLQKTPKKSRNKRVRTKKKRDRRKNWDMTQIEADLNSQAQAAVEDTIPGSDDNAEEKGSPSVKGTSSGAKSTNKKQPKKTQKLPDLATGKKTVKKATAPIVSNQKKAVVESDVHMPPSPTPPSPTPPSPSPPTSTETQNSGDRESSERSFTFVIEPPDQSGSDILNGPGGMGIAGNGALQFIIGPDITNRGESEPEFEARQADDDGIAIPIYQYNLGNCPGAGDSTRVVPCAPDNLEQICDKYSGQGSFLSCFEACRPALCCIHDADPVLNFVSPNCNTDVNCAQYAYCYIVWWKLHDTIGPATALRLEQTDDFFDVDASFVQGDVTNVEFYRELLFHHFNDAARIIELGTFMVNETLSVFNSDLIFLNETYWDTTI